MQQELMRLSEHVRVMQGRIDELERRQAVNYCTAITHSRRLDCLEAQDTDGMTAEDRAAIREAMQVAEIRQRTQAAQARREQLDKAANAYCDGLRRLLGNMTVRSRG